MLAGSSSSPALEPSGLLGRSSKVNGTRVAGLARMYLELFGAMAVAVGLTVTELDLLFGHVRAAWLDGGTSYLLVA